jgi:predicted O-methyltransferase YrrM
MDQRLIKVKARPRAMRSYVYMLYEFVLELKPTIMLEVGTQKGQSSKAILLAMKENNFGKLITVDRNDCTAILNNEYEDLNTYCEFITGDSSSAEVLERVKKYGKFDMALLDGNHKLPVVQQDVDDYFPLVKSGGIILMHDTSNKNEDVAGVWDKIKDEKFNLNWGRAAGGVVPGMGIVRKS